MGVWMLLYAETDIRQIRIHIMIPPTHTTNLSDSNNKPVEIHQKKAYRNGQNELL